MDGKLPITRHFFKVMMPGFLTKLRIPPVFCRELPYGLKLEEAILRSSKGSWHVKVGKCSKGFIYFNEGWNNFVQHHSLNLGDFAVFEHKGKMHFDVYVFDNSACEREFPMKLAHETKKRESVAGKKEVPLAGKKKVPVKLARGTIKREPVALKKEVSLKLAHGIKRESDGVGIPQHAKRVKSERPLEAAASNSPRISHFKSTIKPSNGVHHRAYMNVPLEFIKSNNLSQICSVTLRDPSGKLWLVEVRSRNSSLRTYWYMANGWHEFYVSHKLKEGDVCAFELNHTTTRAKNVFLDVQIVRAPI